MKQVLGVFVRLRGVSKGRRREGGVSVGKGVSEGVDYVKGEEGREGEVREKLST